AGVPASAVRVSRHPGRLALRVLRGHGAAAGAEGQAVPHGRVHPVLLRLRAGAEPPHEEQGQRGERSRVLERLGGGTIPSEVFPRGPRPAPLHRTRSLLQPVLHP
ncbi:unnamed protein product, partial [Ectocarpus sp. 12 AP-2014]